MCSRRFAFVPRGRRRVAAAVFALPERRVETAGSPEGADLGLLLPPRLGYGLSRPHKHDMEKPSRLFSLSLSLDTHVQTDPFNLLTYLFIY